MAVSAFLQHIEALWFRFSSDVQMAMNFGRPQTMCDEVFAAVAPSASQVGVRCVLVSDCESSFLEEETVRRCVGGGKRCALLNGAGWALRDRRICQRIDVFVGF
jgi:hypothetical protein